MESPKVARWYGPARTLALETKVTYDGHVRQPHNMDHCLRPLGKVHTNQLRRASERERLVAEGSTQLAHPWTFQDLRGLINKGEIDDKIMTQRQQQEEAQRSRITWEEQQRAHR